MRQSFLCGVFVPLGSRAKARTATSTNMRNDLRRYIQPKRKNGCREGRRPFAGAGQRPAGAFDPFSRDGGGCTAHSFRVLPCAMRGLSDRPRAPSGVQLCDRIQPEIILHHPQDDAASHDTAGEVDYARRETTVGESSQSSHSPFSTGTRDRLQRYSQPERENGCREGRRPFAGAGQSPAVHLPFAGAGKRPAFCCNTRVGSTSVSARHEKSPRRTGDFSVGMLSRELGLGRTNGAGVSASAAIDAQIGIDLVLGRAFLDGGNGAALGASAAHDASIGDLVSHDVVLLIIFRRLSKVDVMIHPGSGVSQYLLHADSAEILFLRCTGSGQSALCSPFS